MQQRNVAVVLSIVGFVVFGGEFGCLLLHAFDLRANISDLKQRVVTVNVFYWM